MRKLILFLLMLCPLPLFAQTSAFSVQPLTGERVQVVGGTIFTGTTNVTIPNTTFTLTDGATNYIFITTTGVLSINTSGMGTNFQVATVITSNGNIVSITDNRANAVFDAGATGVISAATSKVIYPTDPAYGAKWDVKAITDASFTNTSNVATCPNSDCNFTSADLGKIVFGTTSPWAMTTGCSGALCGQVLIPQGFICAINSASSINIGLTFPGCAADNSTGNCTSGAGTLCSLVWGTQDDRAAINAAALAAWGDGVHCYALVFPSGMAFFTPPILNVAVPSGSPCNGTLIGDATQIGPVVYGQGAGNSDLVPLPGTTNFANCTGGNSGTACIAGPKNWFAHDWGVFGFGIADNGTTHNNNLVEFYGNPGGGSCTATAFWNMAFNNWEAASVGTQGVDINYGCAVLNASNSTIEAFGNTGLVALDSNPGNTTVNLTGIDSFGSSGSGTAGASLLITAQKVVSTGGWYWGNNSAINAAVVKFGSNANAVFNSFGDHILGTGNGNNTLTVYFPAGGTINLSGTTVETSNSSGAGNNYLFFCPGAVTCNVAAYSSILNVSGTKAAMFNNSGTLNYYDGCANKLTQGGTLANSAINVFGSCSVTGTNITAGALVLSAGWGTTAAWTALSGSTQYVQGTITASGSGQAANPTIAYTFPTPFIQTPTACFALQVGGTQGAVANPFTPSALSKTGVTFTYNGTPGAGSTLIVQVECWNP